MPYGRRTRLGRLDLLCIGASPEKLAKHLDIPAIDVPRLNMHQQQELYKLTYKRRVSTLSPTEEMTLQRLIAIAKGRK